MYEEEINFLLKVEELNNPQNERKLLSNFEISELKTRYIEIPEQYLNYLKEIGIGNFRECQYSVKGNLFTLNDIGLDADYNLENTILFFGDNFAGDLSGFDIDNNFEIVELWHASSEIYRPNKCFKEYIREQMLMDEHGNDQRIN